MATELLSTLAYVGDCRSQETLSCSRHPWPPKGRVDLEPEDGAAVPAETWLRWHSDVSAVLPGDGSQMRAIGRDWHTHCQDDRIPALGFPHDCRMPAWGVFWNPVSGLGVPCCHFTASRFRFHTASLDVGPAASDPRFRLSTKMPKKKYILFAKQFPKLPLRMIVWH